MNAQEHERLASFLQQLAQVELGGRDATAEKLIQEACKCQPDAPYLLVQRCLLLDQAVQNAQVEIARLTQVQEARMGAAKGGVFDSNSWGSAPWPISTPVAQRVPAAAGAGTSSFFNPGLLGTVAGTAAGVVAGSFLFQGIEKMKGGHDSKSSLFADSISPTSSAPAENALANNDSDFTSNNINDLDSLSFPEDDPDWV